jgi:hypothetical protein
MREQQGVEQASDIRTAYVANQTQAGVEAQPAQRQLGTTEGRVTYLPRSDRPGTVAATGDVFIEDDTSWAYVYDGTDWHYFAGVNRGSYAAMTGLTVNADDEGALFLVTTAGVNYGLWRVTGGAFVKELLPASPDVATSYRVNGNDVVKARGAAIPDATGGVTVDAEARAAINALLAHFRTWGSIAP